MSRSRRAIPKKQSFFERHRGNLVFAILAIAFIATLFLVLSRHSAGNLSGNSAAINAIGLQHSNNPTDTDIPSLLAAEKGALNEPVLVWFHADW